MTTHLAAERRKRPAGDLARYLRGPASFLSEIGTGKDIVDFRIGPRRFVLINQPALIELVFTREAGIERDRFLKPVTRRFLGPGLMTRVGRSHAERRALLEPVYSRDDVAAYAERIVAVADRAQQGWSPGERLDLVDEMARISLGIVGATLFGSNSSGREHALHEAQTRTLRLFHRFLIPALDVLWSVPVPSTLRFRRAKERVEALLEEEIRLRRQSGPAEPDLLTRLALQPGGGDRLDDEAVRDEVLTFVFGALDQVASSLAWCLLELATRPEIERGVHRELDQVLGRRPPAPHELSRLKYLRQVFAEVLRLHPVAWVVTREVVEPISIDGVRLDAGTTIMVSPYVTQRDPRYWDRPLEFEPGRWSGHLSSDRPFEASVTFGAGDHLCIGRHLVRMECPLVLATIATRWRFRLEKAQALEEKSALTLEPKRPRTVIAEPRAAP